MNQPLFRFFRLALLSLAALVVRASCPALFGQAIVHPNQIRGTIRFTNPPDSPVGRILGPPGNQGFTRVFVSAGAFDVAGTTEVMIAGPLQNAV